LVHGCCRLPNSFKERKKEKETDEIFYDVLGVLIITRLAPKCRDTSGACPSMSRCLANEHT
jgi:hypothetical protein